MYDQHHVTAGATCRDVETVSCDLPSDATTAVIRDLVEKTDYIVTVRAVTAVYFDMLPDGHAVKRARRLPANVLPTDDAWLPAAIAVVTTSGTDRAADLRVVSASPDSISLAWTPPRTYGFDQLQGIDIRWVHVILHSVTCSTQLEIDAVSSNLICRISVFSLYTFTWRLWLC